MEKKYLMMLPLAAVPLFFGGKAAYTAIRKKRSGSHNGDLQEEAPGNIMSAQHSSEHDVMDTSTSEMAGTESYSEIPEDQGQMAEPIESGLMPGEVNKYAEIPDENDGSTTLGESLEEKTIMVGPKGGKYYLNKDGRKIYLK